MGRGVDDSEHQQRIGDLSVKPLRLIQRKPSDFWSNHPQDVSAHGQQDEHGVH